MAHDSLRIPVAIVIAGALVGLGVYFGLRNQRASATAGAAITAVASSVGAAAPTPVVATTAAPISPPPAPPVSRDAVAAAVAKALDAMRADLLAKCWEPHVRAHPGAKPFKIRVNVSLGPDGKQVARGISEDRRNDRSNVGMCLTQSMPAIEIAPPGGPVFVEVPFSLP